MDDGGDRTDGWCCPFDGGWEGSLFLLVPLEAELAGEWEGDDIFW